MKLRIGILVAILSLSGYSQPGQRPVRFPARGTRGAVTGGTEYATEAGMRMLTGGGNAVDAGIATMLAASVTEFSHFGFGGEAPILVRTKEGKVFAIAGSEPCRNSVPPISSATTNSSRMKSLTRPKPAASRTGCRSPASSPRLSPAW